MHTAIEVERIEKEKVQELDQVKSRFFTNISHEFRTPLTLISGPINDLMKDNSGVKAEGKKLLSIVKKNSQKLMQLVNQLMELAKLETGILKLEVAEGDLADFLRTIVCSFLSLAERKKIIYKYELPEAPWPVYFDRNILDKIVTNLISNAFKFNPAHGEVCVLLHYNEGVTTDNQAFVNLSVRDNGKGIPEKDFTKVFDRFYQVSDADTREQEGTGIGLAITKELVDLYRGEILLESKLTVGSTFTLKIPVSKNSFKPDEFRENLSRLEEDLFKETIESEVAENNEPSEIEPGNMDKDVPVILIVEDNTDLRCFMKQQLASEYHIYEAENGIEGLSRAIELIPDLVITDLMMPLMDGREMCENIKNDERTSHIPLIILTAKADKNSKLDGLETGADDYLIKPFDIDELQVRATNLIKQRENLREKFKREFITMPIDPISISPSDKLLLKTLKILNQNLGDPEFNIESMSKELHISRAQLFRKVQAITSFTPKELLRNLRLKRAASLFDSGHNNVTQVMYEVGINNHSHFAKCFRELNGVNPSAYKNKHSKKI